MKNFVGSKGGAGIAQWIISAMPAHRIYVEAFLGKGVILKTKLPASVNIGIEWDPTVISRYWHRRPKFDMTLNPGNCLEILPTLDLKADALVYADPPYLNRKQSERVYYGREMLTEAEHDIALSILTRLQCNVMISGYQSELYSRRLANWRVSSKWTVNRAGNRVEEFLWMNFPEPVFFHDTRFTGRDFTKRQGLKRKMARWCAKFAAMGPRERFAILEALTVIVDDSQKRLAGPPSRD